MGGRQARQLVAIRTMETTTTLQPLLLPLEATIKPVHLQYRNSRSATARQPEQPEQQSRHPLDYNNTNTMETPTVSPLQTQQPYNYTTHQVVAHWIDARQEELSLIR